MVFKVTFDYEFGLTHVKIGVWHKIDLQAFFTAGQTWRTPQPLLNWVKRQTSLEHNRLNWVRLRWSMEFDPGLRVWWIARSLLETLSFTFFLFSVRRLIIINFFINLLTLILHKHNNDGNRLGRYQQHSKISERTGDSYKRGRFFLFSTLSSSFLEVNLSQFFKTELKKQITLLPRISRGK